MGTKTTLEFRPKVVRVALTSGLTRKFNVDFRMVHH